MRVSLRVGARLDECASMSVDGVRERAAPKGYGLMTPAPEPAVVANKYGFRNSSAGVGVCVRVCVCVACKCCVSHCRRIVWGV